MKPTEEDKNTSRPIVVVVVVYLMSTLSPLQVEEILETDCFISVYHKSQMPGGKDVSSGQT